MHLSSICLGNLSKQLAIAISGVTPPLSNIPTIHMHCNVGPTCVANAFIQFGYNHEYEYFFLVRFRVPETGLLTLIGSSVMDATHLILISPYLQFSVVNFSMRSEIISPGNTDLTSGMSLDKDGIRCGWMESDH